MEENQQKIIDMAAYIAPVIHSRDAIKLVRSAIEETDEASVVLDFVNVEFISRSAAHELLVLKEGVSHDDKKEITFINTNSSVTNMLRIVAANRAVPKTAKPVFHPKEISIETLYRELNL